MGDQPVEHHVEIGEHHLVGHVGAHAPRFLLRHQTRGGRVVDELLVICPFGAEIVIRADAACDLESGTEPRVILRGGEQVSHHLHEAVLGDGVPHGLGIAARELEKERVLIGEVVEDRAPGELDGRLEPGDRRSLETVFRETGSGPGEDLLSAEFHVVWGNLGHGGPFR